MKDKVIKAYLWDFFGNLISHGMSFFISVILARLLTPEDFGIIAMALVFISIFSSLSDFGLTQALIQKQENNALIYSSVFYFSFSIGILLFIIFQFTASSISEFYSSPLITDLIRGLSFIFIFNSLNTVQIAQLSRNLDFKTLNIRLIFSKGIAGILGIILALNDFGLYALLTQQIVASFMSFIAIWKMSKWRPTFQFSWEVITNLFSFSGYIFLNQLTNKIVNQLDTLLIGKLFTPSTLGFFGRAQSLTNLVKIYSSKSINNVLFPVLSSKQNHKKEFNEIFHSTLSIVSFISFLLSGVLILSGEVIIIGLFGEKWRPSLFIFEILSIKIFTFPNSIILLTALKAKGKAKEDFYFGLFRKALKLSALAVALFFSFEFFLYASVIASYFSITFNYIACSYVLKIPFFSQFKNLLSFGIIFMVSIIPLKFYTFFLFNMYIDTILSIIVFIFIYCLLSYVIRKDVLLRISGIFIDLYSNKNR